MKNFHRILAPILASTIIISTPVLAKDIAVERALLMAIDDEYKAYATYKLTIEKFGIVRPFSNIIQAEQRHIDALTNLLVKYQIEIPQNQYLTNPHKPIVPTSFHLACQTGVAAEIANAKLYDDKLLPMVKEYGDIEMVFQNLRDASQYRHLLAFQRCAGRS